LVVSWRPKSNQQLIWIFHSLERRPPKMPKIILFAGDFDNPVKCLVLNRTTPYTFINQKGFNDVTSSAVVISGRWKLWEGNLDDPQYNSGIVTENGGPDGDGVYPFGTLPIGNDTLSAVTLL
jgi:hypothetical protein